MKPMSPEAQALIDSALTAREGPPADAQQRIRALLDARIAGRSGAGGGAPNERRRGPPSRAPRRSAPARSRRWLPLETDPGDAGRASTRGAGSSRGGGTSSRTGAARDRSATARRPRTRGHAGAACECAAEIRAARRSCSSRARPGGGDSAGSTSAGIVVRHGRRGEAAPAGRARSAGASRRGRADGAAAGVERPVPARDWSRSGSPCRSSPCASWAGRRTPGRRSRSFKKEAPQSPSLGRNPLRVRRADHPPVS